jgi:hypothetical protein
VSRLVGTPAEWLAARTALLAEEKELTHRSDELARKRQAHAGRHLLLVHIQRRRPLHHRLHRCSLHLDDTIIARGASEPDESDGRARSNSPGCRQGSRAKLITGSLAPRRAGVNKRHRQHPRFHPPRVADTAMAN